MELYKDAAEEIERLRAQQSMAIEVIDASDDLTAENERLRTAIKRIDAINDNPADFNSDINEVCDSILRPHLNQQPTGRAAMDELTAETERLGLYDRKPYLVRATGECTIYGTLQKPDKPR